MQYQSLKFLIQCQPKSFGVTGGGLCRNDHISQIIWVRSSLYSPAQNGSASRIPLSNHPVAIEFAGAIAERENIGRLIDRSEITIELPHLPVAHKDHAHLSAIELQVAEHRLGKP